MEEPRYNAGKSNTKHGYAIFESSKYVKYAIGTNKQRLLLFLFMLGMATSITWLVLSFLASIPADDDAFPTGNISVIFTVMFAVHFVLFFLCLFFVLSAMNRKGVKTEKVDKRSGQTVMATTTVWSSVSPPNKRRIKTSIVLLGLALTGILVSQITFMATTLQPYNTYYGELMFAENDTGVVQLNVSTIAGTCQTDITTRCLVDTIDDFITQSFINVSHVSVVLNFVALYCYLTLFLSFYWLHAAAYKYVDSGNMGRMEFPSDAGNGRTVKLDVETVSGPVWLWTPQKVELGAFKDPTLLSLSIVLWIFTTFLFVMWMFQLLTVAGIYNGLCSWFDKYLIFWLTDFTLVTAFWVILIAFWGALALKRKTWMDIDGCQIAMFKFTIFALALVGILIGATGFIWLIDDASTAVVGIPTGILCRTAGLFRSYNANKVLEITLFAFVYFLVIDYYHIHISKISSQSLLKPVAHYKVKESSE